MHSPELFYLGCVVMVLPIVTTLIAVLSKRKLGIPAGTFLTIACIAGGALSGVGAIGMDFMGPYTELAKALTNYSQEPTQENEERVMDLIASSNKLDREDKEMATTFLLQNPTGDTLELMKTKAETATPEGKEILESGAATLEADILETARRVGALPSVSPLTPRNLPHFDARSQLLFKRYVAEMPPNELRAMGVDPKILDRVERQ